jgi:hypothetical protein
VTQYSVLVIGIPVYFAFQGCFHIIQPSKLQSAEQRERVRDFVQIFLGLPDLTEEILLPLQPVPALKRRWFIEYFLWISGLVILPGIAIILGTVLDKPAAKDHAIVLAVSFCSIVILFFLAVLIQYLYRRKPSSRQAGIREVVAARLGPFSDPADWTLELVGRVAPAFGIVVPTAEELLGTAERLVKQGHHEDALVVAQMALALSRSTDDRPLVERAEDITEDCLRMLT